MRSVDASTRLLLEKLDEEGMPDVVLWVLERVANDPDAAAELKKEVPFRRASALVGTSRNESDSRKRTAIFDEAGREIDRFLAEGPTGRRAIDAYSQKGNLLIQRGRMKVEQAKRPGEDAKKVLAEAAAFFDGAIAALQGTVKPGQPIKTVTNAEDAVVKLLREVDAEIEELSGGKASGDDKGQRKKPVKRTAAAEKQLERLEEEQEQLRTRLMQTRLMIGETFFEKAKALEAGSKEWQQALESSSKEHKELAEKYPSKGAALFARFYQGRNEALLGKREQALATLATVYAIDAPAPMIMALRAKALATALECWMAEKKYDGFDDSLLKFALKPIPGGKPDPDWLALKYRAAALLDARADALPANEKAKKGLLLRDAKKLAVEVATANKDFANEARELAAKLGKDVPDDRSEGDVTFASLMSEAKIALGGLQAKQAAAKQLLAEGKTDEAQAKLAEAAPDRDAAIAVIARALREAADEDVAAINNARYMLTYLLYDGRRFHDAAALGTFLAERYPNAMGSRQAAKISLSSWQLLGKQSDPGWGQQAKQSAVSLATLITKTWPTEAESAEAMVVLLSAAIENRDAVAIVTSIDQLPKESPRRAELLQRAGAALWREVQEKRRLEETVRPDAKTLDLWKARAKASLDEGLAAAVAPPSKIAVAAALSRVQIAIEDGDLKLAGTLLDNPVYGPWAVVQSGSPDFAQGPLAEGGLTVALRYYIQSEQVEKAQQAMDGLEKVAGTGEEASTKLTGLYLAMGRDLQGQLEALNTAGGAADEEVRRKASAILTGFERFLDKVAERDSKISSQMWVATTYLTLGSGGKSGSVVAADKAQAYLDRAAAVYDGLLKKGGEEITKFEPSIRLRMANIFRERQKWDAAQEQIDWILADAKRQNSLETQMQAAEVLQAAGEALAAREPDKADEMLRQATVGRKVGTSVIWGWGGIANKLSRQAGGGGKADEMFYAARLAIPRCMLDRALLSGKAAEKRDELLNAAKKSIAVTRKLYPAMGGPSNTKQFEKLLKDIQKAQGKSAPAGFKEFEEQEAAAAQKPVAAAP